MHVKLARRGYDELTTQLYFEEVPFWYDGSWRSPASLQQLNAADAILDGVPVQLRSQVIATAQDPADHDGLEADSKVFHYDLTLAAVQL